MPDILFLFLADRATTVQLVFLAIVAGLSLKRLACEKSPILGWIAGGILLATYFLRHFSFDATFDVLLALFVRSVCVSHIGMCLTCVLATIGLRIVAKMRAIQYMAQRERRHRDWVRECERQEAERNKPRPAPEPLPPPPTPKEKAQAFARSALEEYDAEIGLLKSLPLDRDEFEVLEMQAKRKLLRKLRDRK